MKHLEFIQGVINRLASNSFLLKGWSVVLASALLALFHRNSDSWIGAVALIPVVVLWGLDGYFLSLERSFRKHYERVRKRPEEDIDFSMDISDLTRGLDDWLAATFSKSLVPFHCVLALTILSFLCLYR